MNNRLLRTAHALYCEPWLIRPEVHSVLRGIFQDHVKGGEVENIRRKAGDALALEINAACDDDEKEEPYQMAGSVAVIPVSGVIGYRVSMMEKSSGVCDCVDIIKAVRQADADSNVSAMVLDIDSPGGTVSGVSEAAAAIANASKPTIAYADSMMASAAYWIGCAANSIYAGPMANLGSVGVYIALLDSSKAYADAGYAVEVFRSGKYKGIGQAGTTLDSDARAFLQGRVDTIGAAFRQHVISRRPRISAETLDGRDFMGEEAKRLGFADSISSIEKAISDAELTAKRRSR